MTGLLEICPALISSIPFLKPYALDQWNYLIVVFIPTGTSALCVLTTQNSCSSLILSLAMPPSRNFSPSHHTSLYLQLGGLCVLVFYAVANYHKCSILKHIYHLIILLLQSLLHQSHWTKLKASAGLVSFCRLWIGSFPMPFLGSASYLHSLAHGSLPQVSNPAIAGWVLLTLHHFNLTLLLSSPIFKDISLYIGLTQEISLFKVSCLATLIPLGHVCNIHILIVSEC